MEDLDQRVEVTFARGREKGLDDLTLALKVDVGCRWFGLDPSAGAAGGLSRRGRRAVEQVGDLFEGHREHPDGAAEFFTTAVRNLQQAGAESGVEGILLVSIVGTDHFNVGYNAAKVIQERAHLDGPVPARILRATQFHEFVAELVGWTRQGDVSYVPQMRTQLVAATSVAEALADLVEGIDSAPRGNPIAEVAGPRAENLVEVAKLHAAKQGNGHRDVEFARPRSSYWVEGSEEPRDRRRIEMGKLIASTQTTLDGVIDPVGEWVQPDGDHGVYSFERQAKSSGMVLGRKTYEGLAGYWPSKSGQWADMVNAMSKYVGSNTLSGDLEWNATLLEGDLADSIPKLKDEVDGDLFMHGSGEFAYALAEKGLIDEYEVYLNPLVWGEGNVHMLGDRGTIWMELEDVKRFDSGVVLLTYLPRS